MVTLWHHISSLLTMRQALEGKTYRFTLDLWRSRRHPEKKVEEAQNFLCSVEDGAKLLGLHLNVDDGVKLVGLHLNEENTKFMTVN